MRIHTRVAVAAAAGAATVLLAGCGTGTHSHHPATDGGSAAATVLAQQAAPAAHPVPHGGGSRLPDDFNGDGHRDLVLNDLVKEADDTHGDDAGLAVVYGTAHGLDPATHQLLDPRRNAAATRGVLPAAFDAEASCDLDRDGYADLILTTDPPFDGIGRPPVPVQILYGGPDGLTARAVTLRIPEKARYGNEWPDHPVCGDFDGDGSADLAVTASGGRISFLRGPFTRTGAPRSAPAPIPGAGPVLWAPEPKPDTDGDGYADLVSSARPHIPGEPATGTLLRGGPDGPRRPGGPYRLRGVPGGLPTAPLPGATATDLIRYADFDGDRRPDLVVRTHRGEAADLVALYPYGKRDKPQLSFSTNAIR
ncbi:hypothetical protein GCM10020367_33800 [Streptomyces sannanensis]|uniref:VCBS repeat-containing protein n=1 Tax=Streptomyces sannanensis TaxID=285536 RepID=A0ABP6SCN2_9ACTN